MLRLALLSTVLGIVLILCSAMPEAKADFQVWVLSSLERASRAVRAGTRIAAQLFAARGEFEAFQIVIKAPEAGLMNVDVKASDLVRSDKRMISKQNITLYREHFVYVNQASPDRNGRNRPRGPGWYPDALIPFPDAATRKPPADCADCTVPFDVQGGQSQPVWIDVFVPRDAAAGQYQGWLTVTSNQGAANVPVALTVWDFDLPLKPTLKTSFGYRAPNQYLFEELLRHKIMPQRIQPTPCADGCPSPREMEQDLMDRLGLAATDVGFWSGADRSTCKMLPPPSLERFLAAAISHPPGLFLFNYTADEVDYCPNIDDSIRHWGLNMRSSGIKNLVVMAPTLYLLDDGSGSGHSAVDIWVVLPKMYDEALPNVNKALAKGGEVWSYNTLVQDFYSPKWLIDYDPINFRIQAGFISQSLGLTGLLYWRVDNWSMKSWSEVNNQGVFGRDNYPGEGVLIYPGTPVGIAGVVPSMRLKQIREGIEDYEYIEILKRLGRSEWALQVARTIGPDWANWSRDAQALESVRRKLGEEIQRLMQKAFPRLLCRDQTLQENPWRIPVGIRHGFSMSRATVLEAATELSRFPGLGIRTRVRSGRWRRGREFGFLRILT